MVVINGTDNFDDDDDNDDYLYVYKCCRMQRSVTADGSLRHF